MNTVREEEVPAPKTLDELLSYEEYRALFDVKDDLGLFTAKHVDFNDKQTFAESIQILRSGESE